MITLSTVWQLSHVQLSYCTQQKNLNTIATPMSYYSINLRVAVSIRRTVRPSNVHHGQSKTVFLSKSFKFIPAQFGSAL